MNIHSNLPESVKVEWEKIDSYTLDMYVHRRKLKLIEKYCSKHNPAQILTTI